MEPEEPFLAACSPEFAQAWHQAETTYIMAGGFIDAACLLGVNNSGVARVRLTQIGFATHFPQEVLLSHDNFFMAAYRQDRAGLEDACQQAITSGETVRTEVRWRVGEDGSSNTDPTSTFNTLVSVRKVGQTADEHLLYLVMFNVSKRRRLEKSLSRAQYTSSLSAMFSEAFTCDLDTGKTEVLFGETPSENRRSSIGFHAYSQRLHPDDRKMFWANSNTRNIRKQLFSDNNVDLISFDLRRMEDDQSYHWINLSITRIASMENRQEILVCVRNLDAQKEAQRQERDLRSKAQTDALTGVFNRGTTEELITAALQTRGEDDSVVLVVFDVDHFKKVNDTYGHLMGDELLKEVATCIKGICRENDIVGRIGGDEFVALLVGNKEPLEEAVGKRIQACLDRMEVFSANNNIDPPITLSAGVVPISATITNYTSAFACADSLLYKAKEEGRNGYRLYRP